MSGILLTTDPESFTEYVQWFLSPETQRIAIPIVVFYGVIWTFLLKLRLTDSDKNINKAKAAGRVIKGTLVTDHISKADYYGLRDNNAHYFSYTYVHPLTGKTKRYVHQVRQSAPPDEIEIYYNEAGKVFQYKNENRRASFWIGFGLIVPMILAQIVQQLF